MLHMKNVLFLLGLLGLAVAGQACSTNSDCLSTELCAKGEGYTDGTCIDLGLFQSFNPSSRGLKQDIAFGRRLKDASCSSDSDCPSDQVCVRYVGASENTCHDDPDFF